MKKWLFCDIEASNGVDICSFGYVITDENLQILEKNDILIKPKSAFTKTVEKMLAYPKELFMTAPTFDNISSIIFQLITSADIIVGHSFSNDIKFLNIACLEYGLNLPELKYFDTQILYNSLYGVGRLSLEKIINSLQIPTAQIQLHRADDDAYLTVSILKKLCLDNSLSPTQMVNQHIEAFGKFEQGVNYEYTLDLVKLFKANIKRYSSKDVKSNKQILNKRIGFCNSIISFNPLKIWTLSKIIIDSGGSINTNDEFVDIYIWDNDTNDKIYKKHIEKKYKCRYVAIEELCSLLKVDWDNIQECTTDNYYPIGKYDTNTEKVIKEWGQDRPKINTIGDLLSKLK